MWLFFLDVSLVSWMSLSLFLDVSLSYLMPLSFLGYLPLSFDVSLSSLMPLLFLGCLSLLLDTPPSLLGYPTLVAWISLCWKNTIVFVDG